MKKIFFPLAALSIAMIFCTIQTAGQSSATHDLNSVVNATLPAMVVTNSPAGPSEIPSITLSTVPMAGFPTGVISGTLSYPSEALPAQRVVAWNVTDGTHYFMDTLADQSDYQLEVPIGTYHVVAYVLGGEGFPSGLAGGYSQMVACGLTASCTDHTLLPVVVTAGGNLTNIDPGDWYAGSDAFPSMP
jgi:hypothetical protein